MRFEDIQYSMQFAYSAADRASLVLCCSPAAGWMSYPSQLIMGCLGLHSVNTCADRTSSHLRLQAQLNSSKFHILRSPARVIVFLPVCPQDAAMAEPSPYPAAAHLHQDCVNSGSYGLYTHLENEPDWLSGRCFESSSTPSHQQHLLDSVHLGLQHDSQLWRSSNESAYTFLGSTGHQSASCSPAGPSALSEHASCSDAARTSSDPRNSSPNPVSPARLTHTHAAPVPIPHVQKARLLTEGRAHGGAGYLSYISAAHPQEEQVHGCGAYQAFLDGIAPAPAPELDMWSMQEEMDSMQLQVCVCLGVSTLRRMRTLPRVCSMSLDITPLLVSRMPPDLQASIPLQGCIDHSEPIITSPMFAEPSPLAHQSSFNEHSASARSTSSMAMEVDAQQHHHHSSALDTDFGDTFGEDLLGPGGVFSSGDAALMDPYLADVLVPDLRPVLTLDRVVSNELSRRGPGSHRASPQLAGDYSQRSFSPSSFSLGSAYESPASYSGQGGSVHGGSVHAPRQGVHSARERRPRKLIVRSVAPADEGDQELLPVSLASLPGRMRGSTLGGGIPGTAHDAFEAAPAAPSPESPSASQAVAAVGPKA